MSIPKRKQSQKIDKNNNKKKPSKHKQDDKDKNQNKDQNKDHNKNKNNNNNKNNNKNTNKNKKKYKNKKKNKQDIPFYENINTKKQHLRDDELNIAESSNDSDEDLEDFENESSKRRREDKKVAARSRWLQSKILQNTELFEGGLDLQGALPFKNKLQKNRGIQKNALVLGAVHTVFDHHAKIYLYGSIPATITIREVSDVLSMEIDNLVSNKGGGGQNYKKDFQIFKNQWNNHH